MKFLLILSLLAGSAFADVGELSSGNKIKCYEKENQELELAWLIGVNVVAEAKRSPLTLFECNDKDETNCRFRGFLKQERRRGERCLELMARIPGNMIFPGQEWELCHEKQDNFLGLNITFNPRRLVPVRIEEGQQDVDAFCEREILKVLYGRVNGGGTTGSTNGGIVGAGSGELID